MRESPVFNQGGSMDSIEVRGPLGPEYASAVSALVRRVFLRFEAPDYPPEGVDTFFAYTDPDLMAFAMNSGLQMVGGCFDGSLLIGVIALRDNTHISLLFVESTRHKQGIGKTLMAWAFTQARAACPETDFTMTVNSSPYARYFYEKMGFEASGGEQVKDGIRFIPMSCPVLFDTPIGL